MIEITICGKMLWVLMLNFFVLFAFWNLFFAVAEGIWAQFKFLSLACVRYKLMTAYLPAQVSIFLSWGPLKELHHNRAERTNLYILQGHLFFDDT